MAHRIEVALKRGTRDSLGLRVQGRLKEDFGLEFEKVRIVDVYTVDADLSEQDLAELAGELSDPIIQEWAVDAPVRRGFDWLVEIGFRPGDLATGEALDLALVAAASAVGCGGDANGEGFVPQIQSSLQRA